ncbi:MAG: glycosyltransferase [bacterium]|nr:glycosyltransferase [bacterium]
MATAFGAIAAGWLVYAALATYGALAGRRLPPARPLERKPRVSVVIPARNEQQRIGRTVEQLLEQRGVEIDVIVVDDRSSDRTPDVLEEAMRRHPDRLDRVRVEELPEDWLGKPWACRLGAERARGDWILFTDADVWMQPDVVARAVAAAEVEAADHVCLFAGEAVTSLTSRAAMLCFSLGMLFFAARANRDDPRSFIGIGAFNLVRSEAYHAIGGHVPLRLEVIDDMKLGLLLRRAGYRSRVYGAIDSVEVHWAGSALGMIRALEKNMFAMFDFSLFRALGFVALSTLATVGAAAGAVLGGPFGLAAAAAWLSTAVPAAIAARRTGWGVGAAFLTPPMSLIVTAAVAHSALTTMRRGGVRWRGTFYSLERLREGGVRLGMLFGRFVK